MTFLLRFAVLASVLGHLTDGRPLQQQCTASSVMEGGTAVLTFNLRQDINDISGDVYTALRRSKRPDHDILACERHSPWICTVKDLAYQESKIVNHTLILYIQNITKDSEDNYTLKTYVNDKIQPVISCDLRVKAKQQISVCEAPSVVEGDTGVMIFHIREDLSASSDVFSATLIRTDDQDEILTCSRQMAPSEGTCNVKNKHFQTDGFADHSLTVLIPKVTRNFEGMYMLRVAADSTDISQEYCYLQVKDIPRAGQESLNNTVIAIMAVIAIVMGVGCLIVKVVLPHLPERFRPQVCDQTTDERERDESRTPLITTYDSTSHKRKRWYFGRLSRDAEKKLLRFKNNKPGSFLVRECRTNKTHHVLTVLLTDGMKYLTIIPRSNGLECASTRKFFPTLCDLVDYYKENEIRVRTKSWGRLSKPFEREPEGDWFFGQLVERHIEKILQRNGPGSFLMTVSNIDEDGYDLSVNSNNEIVRFGIIPEDDCFRMLDTDKKFDTLAQLVEYYQYTRIMVNETTDYGKLLKSCGKDPEQVMTCESFKKVENEFSHSKTTRPGAFVITRGKNESRTGGHQNTQDIFELVVYFEGRPKRFPFRRERNGFLFPATGMFFYSVYELLDFYRMHEIKDGHKVWGKLTQPFRKDPEENCYFGPLGREEERELLLSASCGPGSFLVRDCISDPDHFTLAIRLNGDIVHHRVVPDDTGFSILNTDVVKGTLKGLVQYYQDNELRLVDETSHGKLTEPCKKDPPEDWYFEILNAQEMDLFRKKARPGSFLVTKHETMQRTYTLLVFSQGGQERLKVTSVRNGLSCLTSDMFFYSWYELVAYYTEHDITVGDKHLGRLSKPFRKMCMSEWFSAPLSHEEESSLLLSTRCGTGSFLVRDGASDPKNYVLAVNFGGKVEMFTIIREDNKYGLLHEDAHHTFATVEELVNHYKTAKISVEGSEYGKLTRPFAK